jgi:hypothetical protein
MIYLHVIPLNPCRYNFTNDIKNLYVNFKIIQSGRVITEINSGGTQMSLTVTGFGNVLANVPVTLIWTINLDGDKNRVRCGHLTILGTYLFLPTTPTVTSSLLPITGLINGYNIERPVKDNSGKKIYVIDGDVYDGVATIGNKIVTTFTPLTDGICLYFFNFISETPSSDYWEAINILFKINQSGQVIASTQGGRTTLASSLSGFGIVKAGSPVTLSWTVSINKYWMKVDCGAINAFGNYLFIPTPTTVPSRLQPMVGLINGDTRGGTGLDPNNLYNETTIYLNYGHTISTVFTPLANGICIIFFNFLTKFIFTGTSYALQFTISQSGTIITTIKMRTSQLPTSLSGFGNVIMGREVTLTWTVFTPNQQPLNVGALNAFGNYLFIPTS